MTFVDDLAEILPAASAPDWTLQWELGQQIDTLDESFDQGFRGQRTVTSYIVEDLADLAARVR